MHKKSQSAKFLLTFHPQESSTMSQSTTCDPFSNMKLVKKHPPLLRPICHRRIVSEDLSNGFFNLRSARNISIKAPVLNQKIITPRITSSDFLSLNPNFKRNSLKRFGHSSTKNASRVIKKKV